MTKKDPQPPAGRPSRIPVFATREEEAHFWDTHDITEFADELTPVRAPTAEGRRRMRAAEAKAKAAQSA